MSGNVISNRAWVKVSEARKKLREPELRFAWVLRWPKHERMIGEMPAERETPSLFPGVIKEARVTFFFKTVYHQSDGGFARDSNDIKRKCFP